MMTYSKSRARVAPVVASAICLLTSIPFCAHADSALSTEAFLNRLGVNTHLSGLTQSDPWNTDTARIAAQLNYIGVRLVRDWAASPADGEKWNDLQKAWGGYGRFWSSIPEDGPNGQRKALAGQEAIVAAYPGLIYAMGGPNEEDDAYAQHLGATLPDSAQVQSLLYSWAHADGRAIPVSQMEFGAGWTAANNWEGDYNPSNTGLHQNYTPGPADFGGAHTYISNPNQRMVDVLNQVRADANLAAPGKPVAHTEVGAYRGAELSARVFGQYLVMGAFDSAAAGDAGYIVYGLQDSDPEQTYGFFTYPGGVAHPAADYYHTMTTLLRSTRGSYGPGGDGTAATGVLNPTFSDPSVSHLLLQKPTGELVLAVWSEQLMKGMEHNVSSTIDFGKSFPSVQIYDIEDGTKPIAALSNVSSYTLDMNPSDTYLVVL